MITLTSDEEDDEPAPSLGPPAARAHAAAGAAFLGAAGQLATAGTGTTQQQGATGTTQLGTGGTAAAGAGRKRPASFFASGAAPTQGRGRGAVSSTGWGQTR